MNLIRFITELIPGRRLRLERQRKERLRCARCEQGYLVRSVEPPKRALNGTYVSTWRCPSCQRRVFVTLKSEGHTHVFDVEEEKP